MDDDLSPDRLPQSVGAARVIVVMVREDDVLELLHALAQELGPRLERVIVAETASMTAASPPSRIRKRSVGTVAETT